MDNTDHPTPTPTRRTLFKRRHLSIKSRIPLSNKSNLTTKLTQDKCPLGPEWDQKDSSEGTPSSHASIPNATWVPQSSGSSPKSTPRRQVTSTPSLPNAPPSTVVGSGSGSGSGRPVTPPTSCSAPIDPSSESPLSRIEAFETPFLYGHGTELAPIAEQRSIATLRSTAGGGASSGTVSTSDISSLLKHKESKTSVKSRRSRTESPPRRQLRRQPSFTFNELPHLYSTPATTNTSGEDQPSGGKSGANNESSGTFDDTGAGTSSGSSHSESGVRIPRLRNTSKRHSPPAVESVDIHAYPHKPEYPPPNIRHPSEYGEIPLEMALRSQYVMMEASLRHTDTGPAGPNTYPAVPSLPYSHTRHRVRRVCKACGRPLDQHWSLSSTIIGSGRGQRRGSSWCSRCALRKVKRALCCCNQGFHAYPI
ncbi:uncharacterized protein F4812DRAFT_202135 [Daldinia caldariorum]|uniref:uncharacterized protein n=1 Tax=Daldinia caldariorum TaxID=326644 RepID=UPI00200876FE|nr:uncharacterized protein F4812DRAFT_202135 [Daldinia caldariorum]KAI1472007.1 hypothetical protein F4812DRAFT_202135 [Daldinia caldariorum]